MRKTGLRVIPLLLVIVVSSCASASRAGPPVSDALRRDAEAYAEAQVVSLDEAIRRLRQQDPVGELNAVLREREGRVFGGLWIQHQPEYKVIVLVTRDRRRIRRRYVRGGPLEETVEIRQAERTLEALHTIQQETMGILEEIDSRADTGIDVKRNCVSLFVADPESLQAELDAGGIALPDHVCIEPTGPYAEAPPLDPPPNIIFPRQRPPEGLRVEMMALMIGELREQDGCLRVGKEGQSHLIIWPYDHTVTAAEDGTLQIRDGSGAVVAEVGDVVRMGGGEVPSAGDYASQEIPDRCGGPYWLAASDIKSVNLAELPDHEDIAPVLAALRSDGHALVGPEETEVAFLQPEPGIAYRLDKDGWLHLHVFPDERLAQVRADRIAHEMSNPSIDWVAPPHFYRCGRVIAQYLGTDEDVEAVLDGSLRGPEHCHLVTAPPSEASTSTPAPLESLTVFTAAGLTIEEYAVVSVTVDAPKRFEFMDRVPEDVLARRAAWRDFDAERRLSRLNEALAPLDCRLTAEETTEWRGVFYGFHCEDRQILSSLRRVWSVSVNASGTDFAFVAENAPNKSPGYLLVQKDTMHPLSDWGYVVPVYRGDELLTLERLGDRQFAVKQGEEVLYTYRDRGIRADRPIKRPLTEGENWILEARGEVIVNGSSLNQRLDVDEIFHYVILQGQPLFFFERGGQVRISYGGEKLPVVYDKVVHYQCCEPAMFNVRSNEHMLWFYALREGIWHYVEIGSYTDD
jgi:hypothetical protein